MKSSTFP